MLVDVALTKTELQVQSKLHVMAKRVSTRNNLMEVTDSPDKGSTKLRCGGDACARSMGFVMHVSVAVDLWPLHAVM